MIRRRRRALLCRRRRCCIACVGVGGDAPGLYHARVVARRLILPTLTLAATTAVLGVAAVPVARAVNAEEALVRAVAALPMTLGLLALIVGVLLFALQRRLRFGSAPSCRGCGYPYPDTEKLITACCECGAPWRWYGGLVRGTPIHSDRVRRAGRFLMIVGAPLVMLSMIPTGRAVSVLPTGVISARLAVAPDSGAGAWWDELDRRTIADTQRERIALRLLDRRRRVGSIGTGGEGWLRSSVAALPTNSPVVARYTAEVVDVNAASPTATLASRPAPTAAAPPRGNVLVRDAAPSPAEPDDGPTVEEFLASLGVRMDEPDEVSTPQATLARRPGPPRRVALPTDMGREGWVDNMLGVRPDHGPWSASYTPNADAGAPTTPYLSWGEVQDSINARRASNAWLSRRIGLTPSR